MKTEIKVIVIFAALAFLVAYERSCSRFLSVNQAEEAQPRSQGSLLPAPWSELSLHGAGRREPWERSWKKRGRRVRAFSAMLEEAFYPGIPPHRAFRPPGFRLHRIPGERAPR